MRTGNTPGETDRELKFAEGIRAALPVIVGYLPAGITFGLLARSEAVHIADLVGFSAIVFAGASQFMAINLLTAGATYIEIIVATLLLNFRHFLMGASLSQRLKTGSGGGSLLRRNLPRAAVAYGITDETFSVASAQPRELTAPYLAGLGLFSYLAWNTGSLIGYLGGSYLPARLGSAMGVALYALFAALLFPQLKKSRIAVVFASTAAGLHLLLDLFPGLGKGWAFVTAMVAAALIAALVMTVKEQREED
jgi:4-azaleucine resistance transporter AzlC